MLLVAGENGLGKRTTFDEYRLQSRGGKGIITMKTTDRTGGVVGALTVREADELMLITNKGKMVRTRVAEIRETGRNAQGATLINVVVEIPNRRLARARIAHHIVRMPVVVKVSHRSPASSSHQVVTDNVKINTLRRCRCDVGILSRATECVLNVWMRLWASRA